MVGNQALLPIVVASSSEYITRGCEHPGTCDVSRISRMRQAAHSVEPRAFCSPPCTPPPCAPRLGDVLVLLAPIPLLFTARHHHSLCKLVCYGAGGCASTRLVSVAPILVRASPGIPAGEKNDDDDEKRLPRFMGHFHACYSCTTLPTDSVRFSGSRAHPIPGKQCRSFTD